MGVLLFLGSLFTALGPILAVLIFVLMRRNILLILAVAASFFWLIAIAVAGLLWYIIEPMRTEYAFVIPLSVFVQEGFRYLFFRLFRALIKGSSDNPQDFVVPPASFQTTLAVGTGFALTHVLMFNVTVIGQSLGPGALFSPACPEVNLFFFLALLELGFVLQALALSPIAFDAFEPPFSIPKAAFVVLSHLGASYFTMFNDESGHCAVSVVFVFAIALADCAVAFHIVKNKTARAMVRSPPN